MNYSRTSIASLIVEHLEREKGRLALQFEESKSKIGYFILDEILPQKLAHAIFDSFPNLEESIQKKNLREHKYVAYQMDQYNPILEEVIYAFQDLRVVKIIEEICKLHSIYPDEHLYAGGLSLMKRNNFLSPHLDNSHDKDRNRRRALNLLYYVTPEWKEVYGGNLEIWPDGLKNKPISIPAQFNRLVVMETHQDSWHSVNRVEYEGVRCCVSNYYFSDGPKSTDDFHVTTFRGRPSQKLRNIILRLDGNLRSTIRKIFRKGIKENAHKYLKDKKTK